MRWYEPPFADAKTTTFFTPAVRSLTQLVAPDVSWRLILSETNPRPRFARLTRELGAAMSRSRAAATAWSARITPQPMPSLYVPQWLAVALIRCTTLVFAMLGLTARISAARPATCGV